MALVQKGKLHDIRDDHLFRYVWATAAAVEQQRLTIFDFGCGTGYGAQVLSDKLSNARIIAIDRDREVLDQTYARGLQRVTGIQQDLQALNTGQIDAVVGHSILPAMGIAFEVLEHLEHPEQFLRRARNWCDYLIGSVPHEEVVPFDSPKTHPEHKRHYRLLDLDRLLTASGWVLSATHGQPGKTGTQATIVPFVTCRSKARTLVFEAVLKRRPTWTSERTGKGK